MVGWVVGAIAVIAAPEVFVLARKALRDWLETHQQREDTTDEAWRLGKSLQHEPVPDERCAPLRGKLPKGDWRFTFGRTLTWSPLLVDGEDGGGFESTGKVVGGHDISYGWRDDRDEVHVEHVTPKVSSPRVVPGFLGPLHFVTERASPQVIRLIVAYQHDPPRHALFKAEAPAKPPMPKRTHVAQLLALGAGSPGATGALKVLQLLSDEEAWWVILDVIVRTAVPAMLDAQTADELRKLPMLRESYAQAGALLKRAAEAGTLTVFLKSVVEAMHPDRKVFLLERVLNEWPGMTPVVQRGPRKFLDRVSSPDACRAVLEAFARRLAEPPVAP